MTAITANRGTPPKFTWVLLAWGIFSIIAGISLVTQPGITALVWVQILAIFLVASGVIDIIGAVIQRQGAWLLEVVAAMLNVLIGGFVLANPLLGTIVTIQLLFYLLVFSALINAVVNLWLGFQQPRSVAQIVLGVFQLILGIWLLGHPLLGLLTLVPVMGIYLIVYGILALVLAFVSE
jgi:uncharacterized membrane protein HdeD (DUF308 family)